MTRRSMVSTGVLLTAVTLVGCGGSNGPPRFDISGSVSYGGAPVPGGRIVFEPDTEAGNSGPAAYAVIVDGKYATEPEKGSVGGAQVARIVGFDGDKSISGEIPDGRQLFPETRISLELPLENTTHDFVVPASAAARK